MDKLTKNVKIQIKTLFLTFQNAKTGKSKKEHIVQLSINFLEKTSICSKSFVRVHTL